MIESEVAFLPLAIRGDSATEISPSNQQRQVIWASLFCFILKMMPPSLSNLFNLFKNCHQLTLLAHQVPICI